MLGQAGPRIEGQGCTLTPLPALSGRGERLLPGPASTAAGLGAAGERAAPSDRGARGTAALLPRKPGGLGRAVGDAAAAAACRAGQHRAGCGAGFPAAGMPLPRERGSAVRGERSRGCFLLLRDETSLKEDSRCDRSSEGGV